jgi:acyl-CoA dehydrogenase family protein 9
MERNNEPGFVRELFSGRIASDLVVPYPEVPAEEAETIETVLDSLRKFSAESIDAARHDREHRIAPEVLDGLKELGFFGLSIPEEHGGVGFSVTSYCRVMEEVGRIDASLAILLGAHQSIGLKALVLFGNDEQKAEWLPRLASGEILAAFALTEPEAGSDAASLRTTCREIPEEGVFVLDGTKQWITNGGIAGFFTVFAKHTDKEGADHQRISAFIVTPDMAGFTVGKEEDKLGLKGSSTCQLRLEGVRVPAKNLIGVKGQGFRIAVEVLNNGRTGLGAGCLGGCKDMLVHASAFASQRKQFGRPIAEFELIKEKLARMAASTWALESAVFLTTARADSKKGDFSLEGAVTKVFGTETLWSVINDALQIAGGNGFMEEYPYGRGLRDSRINMIFEGTNEILRLFIALTGAKTAGIELRKMASDAKTPTRWPALAGKILADGFRPEEQLAGLPSELEEEARLYAEAVEMMRTAVHHLLKKYAKAIVDRQYQLERLADAAIDLYVSAACLSRAASSLAAKRPSSATDLVLARLFVRDALARVRRNLGSVETNDDELRDLAAKAVLDAGGDPSPLW